MSNYSFTKLFSSITASSIWSEDDKTRIVWITLLAMADRQGRVFGAVPGLAAYARVAVDDAQAALEKLKAPDPFSRSKKFEGRRITDIEEGGWLILNYEDHRNRRDVEGDRERKRKWARENRRSPSKVDRSRPASTEVDLCRSQKADAEAERKPPLIPSYEEGLTDNRALEAIRTWKEHKRKKFTPVVAKATRKKLDEWGVDRFVAAVDFSVASGYDGLFEPSERRQGQFGQNGYHKPPTTGEIETMRRYAASSSPSIAEEGREWLKAHGL